MLQNVRGDVEGGGGQPGGGGHKKCWGSFNILTFVYIYMYI